MVKSEVKERRQINRKRKLINFALVGIIGIGSGLFLGSWYLSLRQSNPINYSQYTEETLKDDINDAFFKVIGIKNPTDFEKENWVETAKSRGITPQNLTAAENFMLAEYNLGLANSYSAIGTGKVAVMGTSQTIYSAKMFDGNTYTFESISKGILTVADCLVMEKGASTVTKIKGENVSSTSASWTGSKSTMTTIECKENNGGTPDKVIPYIISSKTILSGSTISANETNGKTYYTYTISLDPVKSVINYVKQVKQTSGLNDFPEFSNISITIVLDENWNLCKFNAEENYRVVYGMLKPSCKGTLNLDFTINEPVTLPKV